MNAKFIGSVAGGVTAIAILFAGYAWGNSDREAASPTMPQTTLSSVASRASATGHNTADGTFAMVMTEHNTQAVFDMAKLAPDRAESEEVKDLAAKIGAVQGAAIDNMAGWMDGWGTVGDMPRLHSEMAGALSDRALKALKTATGKDFDQMFLELMIQHHVSAIKVADTELNNGENGDALALAASIVVGQQGEIKQMKALLE